MGLLNACHRFDFHSRLWLPLLITGTLVTTLAAQENRGAVDSFIQPRPSQNGVENAAGGQNAAGGGNAAGGAGLADFDSLIQLIQTTITPDQWEALGGTSTISPYAQGIYVDPEGLVEQIQTTASIDRSSGDGSSALASLQASLASINPDDPSRDWRQPSVQRCVSLARFARHVKRAIDDGQGFAPEDLYFAGLSKIDRIVITDDDVRLIGRVDGIVDVDGMPIDRSSGAAPIELAFLVEAFRCVAGKTVIGCTIDPTRDGLAAAAGVGEQLSNGQIAFGVADQAIQDALGLQRVGVFGIDPNTPTAYRMIAVDRHMKQLALGQFELPASVPNYFDAIKQNIASGVPDDLLLRLWLTANPINVRCDPQRRVFELDGRPIRLACQNQAANADGDRGPIRRDPASESFVETFNENWSAIRQMYPAYGSIESLFTAASIAQTMDRFGNPSSKHLVEDIARLRPHQNIRLRTPRWVQSIAVSHTIRKSKKQIRLLVASGGVSLQSETLVSSTPTVYPNLGDDIATFSRPAPKLTTARPEIWWWNLSK